MQRDHSRSAARIRGSDCVHCAACRVSSGTGSGLAPLPAGPYSSVEADSRQPGRCEEAALAPTTSPSSALVQADPCRCCCWTNTGAAGRRPLVPGPLRACGGLAVAVGLGLGHAGDAVTLLDRLQRRRPGAGLGGGLITETAGRHAPLHEQVTGCLQGILLLAGHLLVAVQRHRDGLGGAGGRIGPAIRGRVPVPPGPVPASWATPPANTPAIPPGAMEEHRSRPASLSCAHHSADAPLAEPVPGAGACQREAPQAAGGPRPAGLPFGWLVPPSSPQAASISARASARTRPAAARASDAAAARQARAVVPFVPAAAHPGLPGRPAAVTAGGHRPAHGARPERRVQPGQQPDDRPGDRGGQHHPRVEQRGPVLVDRDREHRDHAQVGPDQPAEHAQGRQLGQELGRDVHGPRAQGTAQADLAARSSTATSVVLAIPMVPTMTAIPASARKMMLRLVATECCSWVGLTRAVAADSSFGSSGRIATGSGARRPAPRRAGYGPASARPRPAAAAPRYAARCWPARSRRGRAAGAAGRPR